MVPSRYSCHPNLDLLKYQVSEERDHKSTGHCVVFYLESNIYFYSPMGNTVGLHYIHLTK